MKKAAERAEIIKFHGKEEALQHCKRCMALKPGDEVYFEGKTQAVFHSWDGLRLRIIYCGEDNELHAASVPMLSIHFEPISE